MDYKNGLFKDLKNAEEGIVLLGAGGDIHEWINGVSKTLFDRGIAETKEPEKLWKSATKLTTTGGRTDLVLEFSKVDNFDLQKLAIWRISFGDCSWISDYKVNYIGQHTI